MKDKKMDEEKDKHLAAVNPLPLSPQGM